MSCARLWLHLAALLAPLAAAAAWCALMYGTNGGFAYTQFFLFGGIGVLGAQIAALLRWRALERRARDGHGAWLTGIGMAGIAHMLFGVMGDVLLIAAVGDWRQAAGTGRASDIVVQMLFFFVVSVLALGAVTFPTTALLAHWIAALRRRELANDAA